MGYYSDWTVTSDPPLNQWIVQTFREISDYSFELWDGKLEDHCKWYDNREDMAALSRKYPNHLFKVQRITEDQCVDVSFYKNGKSEHVNVRSIMDELQPEEIRHG